MSNSLCVADTPHMSLWNKWCFHYIDDWCTIQNSHIDTAFLNSYIASVDSFTASDTFCLSMSVSILLLVHCVRHHFFLNRCDDVVSDFMTISSTTVKIFCSFWASGGFLLFLWNMDPQKNFFLLETWSDHDSLLGFSLYVSKNQSLEEIVCQSLSAWMKSAFPDR